MYPLKYKGDCQTPLSSMETFGKGCCFLMPLCFRMSKMSLFIFSLLPKIDFGTIVLGCCLMDEKET